MLTADIVVAIRFAAGARAAGRGARQGFADEVLEELAPPGLDGFCFGRVAAERGRVG
ncbi:hypothetical protein [Xylophilus sp.]|uniref:hypothetical protein n=1 Tax=Xylophilus sp. TaxID=2653893 RepID=UPI002D7F1C9E|nr:hypothetical protein [Xylophilus sp.]